MNDPMQAVEPDAMQAVKALEIRGDWFRWSRYDLLNGVVVPAQGADLKKYDPWEIFRANVGTYRTVDQPYIALLELHRRLKEAESKGIRPSYTPLHPRHLPEPIIGPRTEADELILAWCNQHGLLGLVPVLSNSIRPPATIEPGENDYTRVVTERHHFRDGGVWHPWTKPRNLVATSSEAAEALARRSVEEGQKPGVTWFNWMTHLYEEKPLEQIELFFRPVWADELLAPPCPHTREFWTRYGEPVQEFTEWIEMFARCVDCISQWEGGKANVNGEDASAVEAVRQSYWLLSGLAQSAASSFRFLPERERNRVDVDEERRSAGLLASYALMFLWDRMEKRRALRCQNQKCGRYFVSDEFRARYCTPRCRNTAQSRRSRIERRKKARSEDR